MIEIGKTLVSLDLIDVNFCCNLQKCKGLCCIEGDEGAPLTYEEVEIIRENITYIKNYMRKECIDIIEEKGFFYTDSEGDYVTQLFNGKECVFVVFENEIAFCAIEKAFNDKKITFKKPISCHLYPVRIKKFPEFDAINYHKWSICKPAIENGERLKLRLYKFLEESLIRKYGKKWYTQLEKIAEEYLKRKKA